MHNTWGPSPHARFMKRLLRDRAVMFMQSPAYMKELRYDYDRAVQHQKLFGNVWEEYGTNVFQLIAESHGESWDAEDEEKHASGEPADKKEAAVNQRNDDNLAPAREEGARRGLEQLQGEFKESIRVLEEDEECKLSCKYGGAGPKEAAAQKEEDRRREGFYRSAGGTPP